MILLTVSLAAGTNIYLLPSTLSRLVASNPTNMQSPSTKTRRKRISQSPKPFGLVQPTLPSPCLRMTSEPFLHVVWLYLRVYTVDGSALLVSLV
jgi:hypothetical protein